MKAFASSTALTLLACAVLTAAPNDAARLQDRASRDRPFQLLTGGTAIAIDEGGVVYNFGTLTLDPRNPIVHDFKLRNASDKPVTIERIQPACGCTTVTPDNGAPGNYLPVGPGQELNIHVSVDSRDLSAGNIDKAIWVYLSGSARPAVVLHVRGIAVSPIIFEPRQVNFGDVKAGSERIAHFRMLLDPKVYGPTTPDLVASSTGVTVKLDSNSVSTAGQIIRSYSVTLSKDARLGAMRLNLYLPLENGTPYNSPSIFVSANIIGDISASPTEIAFGTLADGQEGAQSISLMGITQKALSGLSVSTEDPSLHGEVTVSMAAGSGTGEASKPTAVLRVTLNSRVKGAYQSRVKVTTKSGQILELPVWAWIN